LGNSFKIDASRKQAFILSVQGLRAEQIGITQYERAYFSHLQLYLPYYVGIYSSLLEQALVRTKENIHNLSVIDYGAGNGMLGAYLKFIGVGQVFVNDINESCIRGCKALASALNLELDGYFQGDIASLSQINQPVDILLSTDVIEHIYNPEQFVKEMKLLQPFMVAIFTTASNPFNKIKVHQLRKLQHRDEFLNSADVLSNAENSYRTPYFERRSELLVEYYPTLSREEVKLISSKSRGLMKEDLFKLADSYLLDGSLPERAPEKYNTCDPDTGNWTERILPDGSFKHLADKFGYAIKILPGLYNSNRETPAGWLKKIANRFILHFPELGKYIAPYIVLIFSPERDNK